MRIAVSGGGTTGHVSPVLATVDALRERNPATQFVYIGQIGGVEAGLATAAGLRFVGVCGGKFRRLPGAGFWRNAVRVGDWLLNLRDGLLIGVGVVQAVWVLGRFRPTILFNKAGPAGVPVGVAAWLLRIPMVIHEPDLVPGLENRLLSRWAAAVAVGFTPEHYRRLPRAKLHYTGNPVQPAILAGEATRAQAQFGLDPRRPVVAVVGGSQGAVRVNAALISIVPELLPTTQIVHVSGYHDYDQVRAQVAGLQLDAAVAAGYHVVPLLPIAELGDLYQAATVVVARAGANTIAELAALRKPAILLPNHQAASHQVANAAMLARARAAVVLVDEQPEALLAAVRQLLASPARRRALALQLAGCGRPDAAQHLAELVLQIAQAATVPPTTVPPPERKRQR